MCCWKINDNNTYSWITLKHVNKNDSLFGVLTSYESNLRIIVKMLTSCQCGFELSFRIYFNTWYSNNLKWVYKSGNRYIILDRLVALHFRLFRSFLIASNDYARLFLIVSICFQLFPILSDCDQFNWEQLAIDTRRAKNSAMRTTDRIKFN